MIAPPRPKPRVAFWGSIGLAIVAMTWWSAHGVGVAFFDMLCNLGGGRRLLVESFPPDFSFLPRLFKPFLETLQIALIGSVIGGILAIPVAVLAARPVSPNWITWFLDRNFMNILRTLPDLFWAMLFATAVGFGPLAGALALTVFTVAVISKLFSESIESIDPNLPEAIRAAGGSWLEMIRFGTLPQVWPQYASYLMYAFELNVRASMVLGLVGAGGIGMILETQRSNFEYERVSLIILVVLVAVLLIEQLSGAIRRRLT